MLFYTQKDKGELSISQCVEYVGQRGEDDFTTTGEVEGTSVYDYAYTGYYLSYINIVLNSSVHFKTCNGMV